MTGSTSLAPVQRAALDMPDEQKAAFKSAFAMLLRHCQYSTYGLDEDSLRLRNIEYALFLKEYEGPCVELAAAEWCGGNGNGVKYPTAGQMRQMCMRIEAAISGEAEQARYHVSVKDFTRNRAIALQKMFEARMLPVTRAYVAARRERDTARRAAEQHAQLEENARARAALETRQAEAKDETERAAQEQKTATRQAAMEHQRAARLAALEQARADLTALENRGDGNTIYAQSARRRIARMEKELQ